VSLHLLRVLEPPEVLDLLEMLEAEAEGAVPVP